MMYDGENYDTYALMADQIVRNETLSHHFLLFIYHTG